MPPVSGTGAPALGVVVPVMSVERYQPPTRPSMAVTSPLPSSKSSIRGMAPMLAAVDTQLAVTGAEPPAPVVPAVPVVVPAVPVVVVPAVPVVLVPPAPVVVPPVPVVVPAVPVVVVPALASEPPVPVDEPPCVLLPPAGSESS